MQLQDIVTWMNDFAVQYGYLGIFVISLIGATSIFVPIPSTVIIFTVSSLPSNSGGWLFDPLWIALAAGIGATIGELTGYLLGFGGRKIIGEKYKKKMDILTRLFKRYGPVVIFVFALTPLPDDLLFIPLGVMRYKLTHALIPAFLGKFASNLIIAYAGRLSIEIIRNIFGVESQGTSALIGIVLAIVLLIIVLVIMFKVDWERRFEKYLDETENKNKKQKLEQKERESEISKDKDAPAETT